MRYLLLKTKKKNTKSIQLEDYVILDKKIADEIVNGQTGLSLSVITRNVYDVREYLNFTKIIGVTVERIETFDEDVHITYLKNNDYSTVVVPKKLLNKKIEYSITAKCCEYSIVEYDSKQTIITHKSKGKHKLKENEVMIKVK